MPNKRKSATIDEEKKKQMKIDDSPPLSSYLPEYLVIENVLTRLPAKDLARFTCVSKLWYNSILNDKRFAVSHFGHNQNRGNLTFNLLNVYGYADMISNYFFHLHKNGDNDRFYNFELLSDFDLKCWIEPVGSCNGLTCVKPESSAGLEQISVINPNKSETLTLNYITREIGGGGESLEYLCHGFGVDSSSQEYKIVGIYTTSTIDDDQGFICMVFTLGVGSWRKIVINTSEISPPPGCSPFPSRMVTRMWKDDYRSATVCGSDLLWRVTNTSDDNDDGVAHEIEMLMSFDIHNEKILFIRLPNECNSLALAANVDGCLEIGHHLLEFKGYPCVARSEKINVSESVRPASDEYRFCCYNFKVHLYILKDKVKQTWIEEENFDVRFMEDNVRPNSVSRDPFDRYFNKIKYSSKHRSHRTRIFSFSDQVMLYWFDGGCLIFYDLRMKHHNVVKGTCSCNKRNRLIFKAKITGLPDPDMHCDVPECPCIDYQLHTQVENIISLKTFIPKGGEVGEFNSYEEFQQFVTDKQPPVGWVVTGRKSRK